MLYCKRVLKLCFEESNIFSDFENNEQQSSQSLVKGQQLKGTPMFSENDRLNVYGGKLQYILDGSVPIPTEQVEAGCSGFFFPQMYRVCS